MWILCARRHGSRRPLISLDGCIIRISPGAQTLTPPDILSMSSPSSHDSRTTQRYLDKYQDILHEKGVIPRQSRLFKTIRWGTPLLPVQAREADAIDILKTKAMPEAEKKCRKLKNGRSSILHGHRRSTTSHQFLEPSNQKMKSRQSELKTMEKAPGKCRPH
jgi:hypothetical protein